MTSFVYFRRVLQQHMNQFCPLTEDCSTWSNSLLLKEMAIMDEFISEIK